MDIKNLPPYIEEWKQLVKENRSEEAEQLYREKILPLSIKKFCTENRDKRKEYDLFIATLGDGWAGTAHIISLFAPKQVLLICTEETEKNVDLLRQYISPFFVDRPKLRTESITDSTDVLQVYKAINDYCLREGAGVKSVALDFTGGTKTMSAGVILAGTALGATDFYYLGNAPGSYLRELRRPLPGSEMLIKVEHPFAVFGDWEAENAKRLASEGNYHTAAAVYKELMEKVPDPRRFELYYLLYSCYDAWDNLEVKKAYEYIEKLIKKINQYRPESFCHQFMKVLPVLEKQASCLRKLQIMQKDFCLGEETDSEFAVSLIMTIYTNALRREKQGKLDMATLLLYRTLEMIAQFTLFLNYGLDTSNPEYSRLPLSEEALYQKFSQLYAQARLSVPSSLPDKISLLHGYAILRAIDDPLVRTINLKQISDQSNLRNNTIFAHGFTFIKESSYKAFKDMVDRLLEAFLSQQGTGGEERKIFDFINL